VSAPEQHTAEPAPFDPTSSVSITLNAKGQHQWVVKIRAQSNAPQDVQEAYELATRLDDELVAKYGVPK
jgi:hypothetical protein